MTDIRSKARARPLPDWWQRENQRRQTRLLILLCLFLLLIGFFYWVAKLGITGTVSPIDFDSANYVAFIRKGNDGSTTLYAVRADGTDLRRLSPIDDTSTKSDPAWTPDGKNLLYSSNREDRQFRQIFILGQGGPHQLTFGKSNKDAPVVSPDGKVAAFVSQGAVKTVNMNGTEPYQVMPAPRAGNEGTGDTGMDETDLRSPFLRAAFSRDGRSIAGVQELSGMEPTINVGGQEIVPGDQVVRALPSGGAEVLFLDTGREVSLAWDPTGSRLATAFTEATATDPNHHEQMLSGIRLWNLANPARPSAQVLLICAGDSIEPRHIAWSPDGTKMAFEGWRILPDGSRRPGGIVVVNVTPQPIAITPDTVGSVRYMLPASPSGVPGRPLWSPNGNRLLFEITRPDGGHDLWVINSDGTSPVNLTNGAGDNIEAAWSPAKKHA